MSPYEISLLLWYYTSPTDPRGNEPLRADTKAMFIRQGLLKALPTKNKYGCDVEATAKLRAYCDALTAVPLPVQEWGLVEKWVMP